VKLIVRCGYSRAALLWLAATSFWLSGCGGQAEAVRSPAPAKVVWGDSASGSAPEPSGAAAEEPAATDTATGGPAAIDLDAPTSKATPARAHAAPVEAEPDVEAAESEPEQAAEEAEPAVKASASDPLALELQKRRASAKARTDAKSKSKGKQPKAKKSASAAAAAPAVSSYTGPDPCKAASFSVPRVREACGVGGRGAAKRVMKSAIEKATATGQSLKCSDCHVNQRDYSLKPDAVAELKRWLESSGS
jgi:hypothetical protein